MDVLRMLTPQMSPDSLREFLRICKSMYSLNTDKYLGYTDINGLQYVGTAENFGSEMFFETRKLRMDRPPAEVVEPSEYMSYYFEIKYSDFIETYDQQNMLMACLKKGVLLSNHEYKIRFTQAFPYHPLRAEAYSDQNVTLTQFFATHTNPKIIIDDTDEIELFVGKKDNTDHHVDWYVQIDNAMSDLFDVDNTTIEADLSKFVDIAAFHFTLDKMRMKPPMRWYWVDPETGAMDGVGNLDWMERNILETGTDGNDRIHLYPYVYGFDNTPVLHNDYWWYIKVYGDFVSTNPNDNANMTCKITKICFVATLSESYSVVPEYTYIMTYDDTYAEISFLEKLKYDDGTPRNTLGWVFRKAVPGDYDYDGNTYNNPINACIPLNTFARNAEISFNNKNDYIPAFVISFKDSYYHPYESDITGCDVGLHIDNTSDYSDNAVDKKFGIAHDLGTFDGLPEYFREYQDRTIHHSHVDIFIVREDANERNQTAMDKQTAGIIVDSSVPLNDYEEMTSDMKPVIVYDPIEGFRYKTNPDNIVSYQNYLSNVVPIDATHFGDSSDPVNKEYAKLPKFIYHGNRHFSTGLIEFDPDLEFGRVYVISNDPASYDNNGSSKTPKPPRTFARICDIPTSFVQLQNIENVSPTLIIDKTYVRQQASFSDADFLRMYNTNNSKLFIKIKDSWRAPYYPPRSWDFRTFSTLTQIPDHGLVKYVRIPVKTINLNQLWRQQFQTIESGSGYAIGDKFGFNIGGIFIKGNVISVDEHGAITDYTIGPNSDIPGQDWTGINIDINLENFVTRISTYNVTTLTGNGNGFEISIEIPSEIWSAKDIRTRMDTPDNVYTFIVRDDGAGLCGIYYDNTTMTWDESSIVQLTGDLDSGDVYYDYKGTRSERTVKNVFLYNMFTNMNCEDDPIIEYISGEKSIDLQYKLQPFEPEIGMTIEALVEGVNLNSIISDAGMNVWNCFIAAVPNVSHDMYYTLTWLYDMNSSYNNPYGKNGNLIFPKHSNMHVETYDNSWTSVKYTVHNDSELIIPYMYDIMHSTYESYEYTDMLRLTKQTKISMKSLIPLNISGMPNDAEPAYSGSTAAYNIYKFDHTYKMKRYASYLRTLSDMSTDELYEEILLWYGDTEIDNYFNYIEREYVDGDTYLIDQYIVVHSMNVEYYEVNKAYGRDVLIVDRWTRDLYQASHPFVSTSIEYDVEHGNMRYIGVRPIDNTDLVYKVLKSFRATTLEHDMAEENILLIGPSAKRQAMIDYLMINRNIFHPYYEIPGLSLHTEKGESLTLNEGEQIGGYIPLVETFHENVTINGTRNKKVDPLYIFKIDEWDSSDDLDNFRLFEGDVDISAQTILLIKQVDSSYKKYVFHDDHWEWAYLQ